jgi:1,4-alpha-glucan branching enzyme
MELSFPPVDEGGTLRVPVTGAEAVEVRFAPVSARDRFDPSEWRHETLDPDSERSDWYRIDLDELGLADGTYEYEYVADRGDGEPTVAADPFAEEITRFDGFRGTFRIEDGRRVRPSFSWDEEFPDGGTLPGNDEMVVYELPLRWTAPASAGYSRDVPLGDFEDLLFERLDYLADLGVNAIELLPVQDAPTTLDWGYGTRFFFAPDFDLGAPVDAKFFVKSCHRRGIRVLLDVVMNHAVECPLETLAGDRFFLDPDEEPDRPSWGGRRFDFENRVDGAYPAREFHYRMAEHWLRRYHVDGFRLDEYKGMDSPAFVQGFCDRAREVREDVLPDRPFLVVAEDSWNRAAITRDDPDNPDGRSVVDSMWNFAFREESRRLLRDEVDTRPGEPSRSDRIEALLSGERTWDDAERAFGEGFDDLSQSVNYVTSHDTGREGEQRLMNYLFGDLVERRGLGDGSVDNVQYLVDSLVAADPHVYIDAHEEALDRVRGAFALLLTSVGVPMFLAGEEFGEVHDLDYTHWELRMTDPVEWNRREYPGHRDLRERVTDLIDLRTSAAALQRNESDLFYAHPTIDENDGVRAFAYCRTGGRELGSDEQVVVVANAGDDDFEEFEIPWWWGEGRVEERGPPLRDAAADFSPADERAIVSLAPFQVRVFAT